ncbi:site-specific DNA-methyltransferase [Enterobacter mori]|uniref:site-specific DNA-methyltransferase n=1 Tax=Enterobacter mori TaxID=539813 RepID=UPI0011DC9DAF|nr:DNA methyltransferase [Enterobacter mori]
MSRLTDLIAKAKAKDPQLAADLDREIKILTSRLPFGLNFERHSPEVVELPLRPIRKGDKVRVLPERGSAKKGDQRLWQVKTIHKAKKVADLELTDAADVETQTVALSNLVVIAEFRDTIWPGLVSTGKVQCGGDKPYHSVINGENYHVLKALTYTHRGKVDAIYIDPPYNTGAKDWKYNNDYVEKDDLYRHSKWLAFMERRLLVAKELLNPDNSVLIVTIDEKEYLRLGLLLEQVIPEAKIQMTTIVINPLGQERAQQLARVEEYAFFCFIGAASPNSLPDDLLNRSNTNEDKELVTNEKVRWERLLRGGSDASRQKSPDLFFPVFVDPLQHAVHSVGEPIPLGISRESVEAPSGTIAIWPLRTNGHEGRWRCSPSYFRELLAKGYARVGEYDKTNDRWSLLYLGKAQIQRVENGEIEILGREKNGNLLLGRDIRKKQNFSVKTVWNRPSHRAGEYGTSLIRALIPNRRFPYPKSLYAVEDALRIVTLDKPNAIVVDFFSGSGTTAHAVMRLNKQDGGRRQCISVTNNEVAADEQKKLREQGLRPGDPEWEKWGICDYITKPRIQAAITGKTPEGEPIKGDYKFTDEFPMSVGFEENAEFFTLTYEAEKSVSHNLAYARIAPLLWLRAGARGNRIEKLPAEGWAVTDTYGLLSAVDQATPFIEAISHASDVRVAFIVTDDDRHFQAVTRRLPRGVEPVRLYESYLTNFSFTSGELAE